MKKLAAELEQIKNVLLPSDAIFQGYRKSRYYDFEMKSELIELQRKMYYSASTGEYYVADFPLNHPEGKGLPKAFKKPLIV